MADQKECFAFDLDGTMAKRQEPFNPYSVGEPIKAIVDMALEAGKKGTKLLCFTARASSKDPKMLSTVRTWLDKQGLQDMKITNIKTPAITKFFDDKAVGVVPDEGKLLTKVAAQMVRKTRLVEQHDDHCPHCDHQFQEKGYPRPDFAQAEREGIDPMYADMLCPACKGIVDGEDEMTDDEIENYKGFGGDGMKSILKEQREKRRDILAKRHGARKVSLDELLDASRKPKQAAKVVERNSNACPHCSCQITSDADPRAHDDPSDCDDACPSCGHLLDTEKEAALRPLKERMQRLRARRGECFECGGSPHDHSGKATTCQDCGASFTPGEIPNSSPMDKSAHRRLDWLDEAMSKKKASTVRPARTLITYVPLTALESVRQNGLLSGNELAKPENRTLLETARNQDNDDSADAWLQRREQTLKSYPWISSYKGPSVFFGEPDPDRIHSRHPLKRYGAAKVRINLEALLADKPDTKLHGVELVPFDKGYDDMTEEEKDQHVLARHHDLTEPELDDLITRGQDPQRMWRHYHDPKGVRYAGDVPHAQLLLDRIDPKYLDFSEAGVPAVAANAQEKSASTQIETLTGPHGILQALKNLDVDALRKQANDDIASGKLTRRDKGVKMLNALEGLRRNNIKPEELMIHRIPVLPPAFRPFAFLGNTYVPGDANELYQDIFKHRAVHDETLKTLGEGGAAMTRMNLLNATRALYGYGDPVSPKLKERAPAGYLTQILGDGPKHSFVQRRLLSKTIDNVGRSVITVDPDMDMNHSSIPRDMAWTIAGSAVHRRLAQMGMSPMEAIKAVKDRSREATQALEQHLKETPFLLGRSPAWHKFNNVGQYMSIHDGPHIAINPYIAAGLGADHDGDQVNVSLPVLPDSIQEAKDKLMPDKMLFSIKDPDRVVPTLKHETTLGIWTAGKRPATKVTRFASGQEALAAMQRGDVKLHDDIDIPDAP